VNEFDPKQPYLVPPLSITQLREAEKFVEKELLKARVAIAKLDGFMSGVPSSQNALMSPIYLKEAVESSEIENINTTLLEVLQQSISPKASGGRSSNSQLVVNYFFAMRWGTENVTKVGLSSRLIKGLHMHLLPSENEDYRRLPVVIGDGRGAIRYTPPQAQHIPSLLSDWEKTVNNETIDPLVLAAAAHYQFEAIHPFEDGNGRTGRMLLTLHLVHAGLLKNPAVHISQYINHDKGTYYQLLRGVTEKGELKQFIQYLIKGFTKQAQHSYKLMSRLNALRNKTKRAIRSEFPHLYSAELIEAIFLNPVQSPVRSAEDLGVHYVTASKYLQKLAASGYLKQQKNGRHTFYINTSMLDMIEEKSPIDLEDESKNK
jgi:Fic family protein